MRDGGSLILTDTSFFQMAAAASNLCLICQEQKAVSIFLQNYPLQNYPLPQLHPGGKEIHHFIPGISIAALAMTGTRDG
jgi:hypothetical protein